MEPTDRRMRLISRLTVWGTLHARRRRIASCVALAFAAALMTGASCSAPTTLCGHTCGDPNPTPTTVSCAPTVPGQQWNPECPTVPGW